ncbi:MAG: VWA domain-containing protein [Candidatus Micrarchaeia archaeon]
MGHWKKGMTFSIDAIFAIFLLILISSILLLLNYSPQMQVEEDYNIAKDALTSLDSIHISDLAKNPHYPYLSSLISCTLVNGTCPNNCEIGNLNNTILEQIGEFWATNRSHCATQLINESLDSIIPSRYGFQIGFKNESGEFDTLYTREKEYKKIMLVDRRIISGLEKNMPVTGWSARASLGTIKKYNTHFVYFGGYEGDGNITKVFELPFDANITGAYLEADINSPFKLYINGNDAGTFSSSGLGELHAKKWNISDYDFFNNGPNTVQINFTSGTGYVGGGFLSITYNTSIMREEGIIVPGIPKTKKYLLPGIKGIINLYSSFDSPGELTALELYLHYVSNYSVFFNIGNMTVYYNDSTSETTVNITSFPDLNFSLLSNRTVPIRFGTEVPTQYIVSGVENADVIMITDCSGSMDWDMNGTTSGVGRACDDPLVNDSSTKRISLAKCLNEYLVDRILSASGTKLGLICFSDDIVAEHELSNNSASLKATIATYAPRSGTCICCGLNRARQMLQDAMLNKTAIVRRSTAVWKETQRTGCGNGCDASNPSCSLPIGWYLPNFDDSSWNTISTPDDWWSQRRVRMYRTTFNLPQIPNASTLRVRHSNGMVCYINGNLVGNDSSCSLAYYWNNEWDIGVGNFTVGTNTLACAVRTGASAIGMFDAELEVVSPISEERERFIILMSDGVPSDQCSFFSCEGEGINGWNDCSGADCNDFSGCSCAVRNSNYSACKAHNATNATIISIGFGPVDTCTVANTTLKSIAECGNGTYMYANNSEGLWDIFRNTTELILNASYKEQTIEVKGDAVYNNTLFPDSYIKITYIPSEEVRYGEITISAQGPTLADCTGDDIQSPKEGCFTLSNVTRIIDAHVTSYSGPYWTAVVDAKAANTSWTPVFRLNDFGTIYTPLGDPFSIFIPPSLFASGIEDRVRVDTATSPTDFRGASPDDRIIYSYAVAGFVPYGGLFPKKSGCNRTVWYDIDGDGTPDGSVEIYFGNGTCTADDALNDALTRLLRQLLPVDRGGEPGSETNPVGIEIKSDIQFEVSESRSLPYMWGPAVIELRVWR